MSTYGLTLADIRTRVSSAIGLDNTSGSAEQLLIDSWTNEAIVDFLERTKAKVEVQTITLTSGTSDYELGTLEGTTPAIVIQDLEVTNALDGQVLPLEPLQPEELLWRRRYPGASPVRYYAIQGNNLLMLYPTPQSPDTLTMYYVPLPTLLATGTDALLTAGVPPKFQYLIELYVKAKAGEYNDHSSSQNGMTYFQLYENEAKKARGRIRRAQGRRRPPALPGRSNRRKYYPAFPGQDIGT